MVGRLKAAKTMWTPGSVDRDYIELYIYFFFFPNITVMLYMYVINYEIIYVCV